MNKITIIVGVVIIALLIGGGLLIANKNSQKTQQEKSSMVKQDTKMTEEKNENPEQEEMEKKDAMMKGDNSSMKKSNDTMMAKDTRYIEYSKTAFEKASSNRRVLFFYANWCPTCRPADANFKENTSKIPNDVTLIRVNYNDTDTDQEEKDLAKKYGVTYQHTFVQIDGQGKQIAKWNGGQIEELLSNIK